ncbi:MAG: hypothetical protein R6W70_02630 [bacterium]
MKNLESALSRFSVKIERLEHLFNLYFGGQERRPPLKEFESLKKEANHIMNMKTKSNEGGIRHKKASLIQKFTSHRLKWEKSLKDMEEGRIRPGKAFFGTGGSVANTSSAKKSSAAFAGEKNERKSESDRKIDKAAENYVAMAKKFLSKRYNSDSIRNALRKKLTGVKNKFGDNFDFKVYYDGEKVKVKPVKKND